MAEKISDQLLVRRVQQGDRRAFDALVLRYQQRIVKLIMRYLHDPAEAQDVAQEAFIKAYRALPAFRGDSAFYTWLYRIAINTAKNHLAALQRKPVDYELDAHEPDHYELNPRLRDEETPEGLAMQEQLRRTVERTIASLPAELRTAIMLREIDGLSYEDIASAMDCPVGTVRSRIFRAREAIDRSIDEMVDR
ncbi:MAG: RNA polymerase sigma factor RpoE [Gammaproteobacteria bacterium]|nr:MAG: RNA polymerase sigma factor RpoE [Gammaproteobacteria bacterium]